MTKYSIKTSNLCTISTTLIFIALWQVIYSFKLLPVFMLPSPAQVLCAFIKDVKVLAINSLTTLNEAFLGITISIILSFIVSALMDRFTFLYQMIYPIIIVSQTIPTVAIAPILILWLGYDIAPKVVLIVMSCFFPIAVGLIEGFKTADKDMINLLKAMGASKWQIFKYIKLPVSMPGFFSGLKIAASYSIISAVVSEWLGGYSGLGVYMIRAKKAYAFDKMFAALIIISLISLALVKAVCIAKKHFIDWDKNN